MNIKITHNWLLEYLDTKATPDEIQKYLSLCGPSVERVEKMGDDYVYEIEITSNRIDTASVVGIAREAYAILNRFGIEANLRPVQAPPPKTDDNHLPLEIRDDKRLETRVVSAVMDNIQIKQSPSYIKKRLEAIGIRSLNNIIDITNYVMVELGHPTHVMDYDRIKTGKLIFRRAIKGETLTTLDGKNHILNEKDIVVDDGSGRIVDLPGIMGTENSVVNDSTKRTVIFIESNKPQTTRQTSMRLGIRTMAATYEEKDVDPELSRIALYRVIQLFQEIAGARLAGQPIDIYHEPVKPKSLSITVTDVERLIGVEIPKKDIIDILVNLEFVLQQDKDDTLTFLIPSYRMHEVTIKEDLIEEIARIYGYFRLPNNLQPMVYVKQPKELENLFLYESKIKYFLKHLGLREVVNYSMVSEEMINDNGLAGITHLRLKNTISEQIEYMRLSLLPSLIKNIKDNEGKESELKFFEIGKTYEPVKDNLPAEEYHLAVATNTDFSDMKGIVDALLKELNIENYNIIPATIDHNILEKGWGVIRKNNESIAEFGRLKISHQNADKIENGVFLADFNMKSLISNAKQFPKYKAINPYAVVKLDLTIEENKPYAEIKVVAFKESKLLIDIDFVGKYENKITLRFYFSAPDRNITEEEAKKELEKIKSTL